VSPLKGIKHTFWACMWHATTCPAETFMMEPAWRAGAGGAQVAGGRLGHAGELEGAAGGRFLRHPLHVLLAPPARAPTPRYPPHPGLLTGRGRPPEAPEGLAGGAMVDWRQLAARALHEAVMPSCSVLVCERLPGSVITAELLPSSKEFLRKTVCLCALAHLGIPSMIDFGRPRRINRATGAVTREALYDGQSMDHPKVNPLFAGRRTRFAFFNGSFHVADQPNVAGPPQVRRPIGFRVVPLGRSARGSFHVAEKPNEAGPGSEAGGLWVAAPVAASLGRPAQRGGGCRRCNALWGWGLWRGARTIQRCMLVVSECRACLGREVQAAALAWVSGSAGDVWS